MNQLKQKRLLSSKSFELHNNKIAIKERYFLQDSEWEARYSELGLDLIKVNNREGIGNIFIFGGLFILSVLMMYNAFIEDPSSKLPWLFVFFSFMWGTALWWTLQKQFGSYYILDGGRKTLYFFTKSPTPEAVKAFIEEIKFRVREQLKAELTEFDPDMSFEDQLSNLKYLKNIEVINQEEYAETREYLRIQHMIK